MKNLFPFLFVVAFGLSVQAQENSQDARAENDMFISLGGLLNFHQIQRNEKVASHDWWMDLAVGYSPTTYLSVGALYAIDQTKENTSGYSLSTSNYESRNYRASVGPQIHLWWDPFYLAITYFVNSKLTSELTTDGLSPYKYDGTGSSIELGYLYSMGSIQFSLSLLYRNWEYKERTQNGGSSSTLSPTLQEYRLDPSLKVWWVF